jgi:hypothetical protein
MFAFVQFTLQKVQPQNIEAVDDLPALPELLEMAKKLTAEKPLEPKYSETTYPSL